MAEGQEVIDTRNADFEKLNSKSDEEALTYYKTLPLIKLTGINRFTYPLTNPLAGYYLLKWFVLWFVTLFISTLWVSALNEKNI